VYLVALRLQYPYVPSPALVCSFALSTTFAQLGVFNLALQPQRSGYPFPCPLPGPQGTEEEKKGKQSEATDKQGQQTRCSRCQIIRENEKSVSSFGKYARHDQPELARGDLLLLGNRKEFNCWATSKGAMFDVPAPREHNRWGEGEDEEENAFDFLFDSSLSDEDDHSEAGALKIECFGYCSLSALWKDGYISAPALASLSPPPEEKEEAEAQGPEERREEIRDHQDTQPTIAESPAGEQGPDIEAGTEAEEEITTDHAEGEITPAANATEAVPLPGLDHHQNMLRLLQQRTEARLERRQAATREYYYQYSLNFVDTPYKWSSPKRIFLNLIENMIPLWLSCVRPLPYLDWPY